ncbi:MAG: thioredoxin family protein [Bdellovibrionales bacterium]|nr:thioredoxin family protein [Bdellovibrionales bacterium]
MAFGDSTNIKVHWGLSPGFHAYLDQFILKTQSPEGIHVSLQEVSPIETFYDKFTKKSRRGVKDEGTLDFVLELPEYLELPTDQDRHNISVQIQLTYQACSSEICLLPKTIPLTFTVKTKDSNPPLLFGKQQSDLSLWFAIFIAGILTSFTPCVFPLIPITLSVLGARQKKSNRKSGFFLSLCYVLGIAITYATLGLIAASTGVLFGSFLGHPAVALVIAFVFIILALSSLDVFTLQAPNFIRKHLSLHKTQGGLVGAFFTGLIAGIIASPCVGPVLAAILTYVAKTQNLKLGFGLLFVFAFGLGQLFLLLGTFSGLQKYLPKSGPWMVYIKYIFSLTFFIIALFYLQPLWTHSGSWFSNLINKNPQVDSPVHKTNASSLWIKYSPELMQKAFKDKKPVVIDFYADWCAACKELELKTLNQPEVVSYAKEIVFLRFDATQTTEEFKELQKQFNIVGLPHLSFINNAGKEQTDLTLNGFEAVAPFTLRLKKLLQLTENSKNAKRQF